MKIIFNQFKYPRDFSPRVEFHVARQGRDRYKFEETFFAYNGNVLFANFHAARLFAKKINDKRDLVNFPEQAVRAGQINAMGLLDEILHIVVEEYTKRVDPDIFKKALAQLTTSLGKENFERVLVTFCDEFPPVSVYKNEIDITTYLEGENEGIPNGHSTLEEILMLWISNANPALTQFSELFDDTRLDQQSYYPQVIRELQSFFLEQPTFGPQKLNLFELLQAPAKNAPHSLTDQLEYIRKNWGDLLGNTLFRLLSSLDFIKEEEKLGFQGPGPAVILDFKAVALEKEEERFSQDLDWMPKLVLIAKNTFVWLDQLSKKYNRSITQLDHIPDDELEALSSWGFSGLWLIGLWERSIASQNIKHLTGNPDAISSAYSLYDYQIATELGGDSAYENLRDRATRFGIRLAADMVPNHTGIYSKWILEHPEWFISLPYPPFPSYTFSGPDLSQNPGIGIYLEDHYYSKSDAAVVFKRVNHHTGETLYIYHGNDGTSMPWNDTAQLNFLNAEAREEVIQAILHVARKFSVIRFDAAMTLAKKHIQRLWFPEPGSGGAIPSRAEAALTRGQFNEKIPNEFWRDVVDRVAQEVPDTLLLAEAFWMMEGYFVRTLGMHRVYNSAFMNMLRDEKNAEYRLVIKNTLEFDPQILKRYVNFMNNPDEKTAVEQFGKGGKYFGICIMMSTMPGLPMFGHGQIEGLAEKYGMEFKKPLWDEQVDHDLINRHQKEIFPLLHKRYLFANVENFLLYDLYSNDGYVNEDVFAYSNQAFGQHSLVLYHNKWANTSGWIRDSVSFAVKDDQIDTKTLVRKTISEGLGIPDSSSHYILFRDQITGLEYIRNCLAITKDGLYVELGAFQYHVFLDFRVVEDNEWGQYAHLTDYLRGRGVPSLELALREIFLQPILIPFKDLVNAETYQDLFELKISPGTESKPSSLAKNLNSIVSKFQELGKNIQKFLEDSNELDPITIIVENKLVSALSIPALTTLFTYPRSRKYKYAAKILEKYLDDDIINWGLVFTWIFIQDLGMLKSKTDYSSYSRSWIDEWLLGKFMVQNFSELGCTESQSWEVVSLIKILVSLEHRFITNLPLKKRANLTLHSWLENDEINRFLQINRFQGILWYNKEAYKHFVDWLFVVECISILAEKPTSNESIPGEIVKTFEIYKTLLAADEVSGYQVETLLRATQL